MEFFAEDEMQFDPSVREPVEIQSKKTKSSSNFKIELLLGLTAKFNRNTKYLDCQKRRIAEDPGTAALAL